MSFIFLLPSFSYEVPPLPTSTAKTVEVRNVDKAIYSINPKLDILIIVFIQFLYSTMWKEKNASPWLMQI